MSANTAFSTRASAAGARAVLPLFVATLFLSAFLLFGVQPMFAKMVLPILGGSPAVWSVAMVFFQLLLLAGYLYAHLLTRLAPLKIAALLHLGLVTVAFLVLPIAVAPGFGKPPSEGEALWLLGLFAASVGLPFFAVAGNGPLLQAWFARSGHAKAHDPYFLYAASNVGSFAALIAYPVAIEPLLPLKAQSQAWSLGFAGLAAGIAACGIAVARTAPGRGLPDQPGPSGARAEVTAPLRLAWIALALVPSGLLVAVTAHISTDVAAAPLLWIAPLAIFLLTFVLAFREPAAIAPERLVRAQVWLGGLALLGTVLHWALGIGLAVHLGFFALSAYLAHLALYRLRPAAGHLTEFYLWISFGGALGGLFCGLLAPNLFSRVAEYPLLIAAALLCRPGFFGQDWRRFFAEAAQTLAAALALGGLFALAGPLTSLEPSHQVTALMAFLAAAMMAMFRSPSRVAGLALALLLCGTLLGGWLAPRETLRSFFGVHTIAVTPDGEFRTLGHGTTTHGAMRIADERGAEFAGRPEPTLYFTSEGPIGEAIASVRAARGGVLREVGTIGLGAGAMACASRPGEAWTFFEIDPVVAAVARDPARFRFLSECAPDAAVVLGDARLTLAESRTRFDLLVVDAFSSDAIPAHLLTREAMGLYLARLTQRGVIVMHVSNRHLDLRHILARVAAEHGLVAYRRADPAPERGPNWRAPSVAMALARDPADLGAIAAGGAWTKIEPDLRRAAWTDDYSNIIEAILDRWRER